MISTPSRNLALFDLDGTLLPWDTQLLFSNYILRLYPWRRLLLLPFLCCIPLAILQLLNDARMKRIFLSYLWKLKKEHLNQIAKTFATELLATQFYPELIERIAQHKKSGDLCILTTASPSIYSNQIGSILGFDEVYATDIMIGDSMNFYPNLTSGNNKGQRKVDRLTKSGIIYPGQNDLFITAYSDSLADIPMLLCANRRVLINPSQKLVQMFPKASCEILRPIRPWQTRTQKILYLGKQFCGLWRNKNK